MNAPLTRTFRFDDLEARITETKDRADLFAGNDFQKILADRFEQKLGKGTALSLDVFDTLILRDNSAEVARFFEVGGLMAQIASKHLGREITQIDAFLARQMGTEATYRASARQKGCREGSLTEIHKTASRILTGSDDLADAFITAELENEAKRIKPNPFFQKFIPVIRARGIPVILVSDMYMHRGQIERLLTALGFDPKSYDGLISSADTKVSKASGGIFSQAVEAFELEGKSILHAGDSQLGDLLRPVQHGWRAIYLPLSRHDIAARKADEAAFARMLKETHGIRLG